MGSECPEFAVWEHEKQPLDKSYSRFSMYRFDQFMSSPKVIFIQQEFELLVGEAAV